MLFSMCDFFATVCNVWLFHFRFENESTVITGSNFWKQIVAITMNVVNKISHNPQCAL